VTALRGVLAICERERVGPCVYFRRIFCTKCLNAMQLEFLILILTANLCIIKNFT